MPKVSDECSLWIPRKVGLGDQYAKAKQRVMQILWNNINGMGKQLSNNY